MYYKHHQTDESFISSNVSLWRWNLKMSEFRSLCNWYSTAIGSSAFKGRGLPIAQLTHLNWFGMDEISTLSFICIINPWQRYISLRLVTILNRFHNPQSQHRTNQYPTLPTYIHVKRYILSSKSQLKLLQNVSSIIAQIYMHSRISKYFQVYSHTCSIHT